jgi:hypothetical protein
MRRTGGKVIWMPQSKGVVRRIIEEDEEFLVCFANHDGYFHVEEQSLRNTIRKAEGEGREISFTYDPTLKILVLAGHD